MNVEQIRTERTGAVATVTVNRPKVLNALNSQTVEALTSVLIDLQKDDEVRSVVLTGAGDRAFIAGADIGELAQLTPRTARALTDAGHRLCTQIEHLGKPVIAAVNGYALGGGCEVAMACTCRIAARTARLGLPEITLGIIPGTAAPNVSRGWWVGAEPSRCCSPARRSRRKRPGESGW